MSFEEPKAPIVRIRKKKVKKKTKDKEIVHLPVRASTQARYTSLTGGQDPQSKSRECCRHVFAGCFKIPICRTICFRCILPSCYKDIGSDEEEGNDEGYHSQNRHSSEVPASFSAPGTSSQGATAAATADNAVEMTEIKTTEVVETVALIPPPRIINDYRKDPCSRQASSSSTDSKGNQKTTGEITYIEVESVPVVRDSKSLEGNVVAGENIPDDEKVMDDVNETSGRDKECSEERNEIATEVKDKVVINSDSPETDKKFVDIGHETHRTDTKECKDDPSEYVECDNIPEKQQYFNFDNVNMPKSELIKSKEHDYINGNQMNAGMKVVDYANLDAVDTDSNGIKKEFDFTASEEPHDYMNLSELESKKSDSHAESVRTEISQLVKMTKSQNVEPTEREDKEEDPIDALKKQCLEVLESEFSDKDISDHEDAKENSTTDMKDHDKAEIRAKDTAVETMAVKNNAGSETELETDRAHLVQAEDSEKLVGNSSKNTKNHDNISEESDSDSNGKKVTDQTKLI